jgi:DNA-binding NarL/FixJ family response regulator
MPFKGFEAGTIEVPGEVSSLYVVHAASLMRMGIASALRVHAGLHGAAIVQGARLGDLDQQLRQARRGDILICDVAAWSAIEKDGTGLAERIRQERVAICLVACTDHGAHRLLQLRGIAGVVSSDCDAAELELAVGEIADGRTYFKSEGRLSSASGMSKLSSRQIEILELMTRGLLNKQIAWELGVTEGTVKSHVSAILEKLGCDRRTQAIAAFLQSLGVGTSGMQRSLHS